MTGLLDIPSDQYHADQLGDQPSLSASIAKILVGRSPAHAREAHPRLNPRFKRDDDPKFDLGTACHALMLEGRTAVEVCPYDDWRTNAAKKMRKEARSAGRIPLLSREWETVQEMRDAATVQLARHQADPPLFTAGTPEKTLVWTEDGVQCRARIDWLHDDLSAVDDLKTTKVDGGASRDKFARTLFSLGYDLSAAFYIRGCQKVLDVTPEFRWAVIETQPPYAVSVFAPSPETLAIGAAKVEMALALWLDCSRSGDWPAYSTAVQSVEAPPWETRWLLTPELEETAWAQF